MSAFLHVPSLLIAAAVTGACVSISQLLIGRAVRSEVGVLYWGTAYGLITLSMVMVGLRGFIPVFLSVIVSNALLLLAFGFFWLGYRRFIGKVGTYDHLLASLGGVAWLLFACDRSLFADINLRVQAVSAGQFIYLLIVGFDLVGHWRKEPLPAFLITVAVIAAQQALLVARIVYLEFSPLDPTIAILPTGTPIGLTLIGSTALIVFFGLLQLALVGQRSERRLRVAAETDGLTGLANRRRFMSDVLPCLAASPHVGALVLFDLDHFKNINDTHGHLIGDRALAEFAHILAKAAPQHAIAARIGGEEFALFLPSANAAKAAHIAEHIRELIRAFQLESARGALCVTVSGGVAGVEEVGSDYEALHSAADAALYKAKSDGRDRIVVHRGQPQPSHPVERATVSAASQQSPIERRSPGSWMLAGEGKHL